MLLGGRGKGRDVRGRGENCPKRNAITVARIFVLFSRVNPNNPDGCRCQVMRSTKSSRVKTEVNKRSTPQSKHGNQPRSDVQARRVHPRIRQPFNLVTSQFNLGHDSNKHSTSLLSVSWFLLVFLSTPFCISHLSYFADRQ